MKGCSENSSKQGFINSKYDFEDSLSDDVNVVEFRKDNIFDKI